MPCRAIDRSFPGQEAIRNEMSARPAATNFGALQRERGTPARVAAGYLFISAALAASVHFTVSLAMNAANSSGELPSGSKPDFLSLATTSSFLSAPLAAAESLSITG